MAQDVSTKMAEEPWILNEDGYLNADTEIKEIVYHPTLNVILLCTKNGIVKVLDVNTGVVLQSSNLSAINHNEVTCRYIPVQDRILFTDGQAIGVRSEYNGVLLLDSILQKIVSDSNEVVSVELPLSEAIILKQSLLSSGPTGVDHVLKELTTLISNAQKYDKKGIKAQKWNTICLKLPLNDLRSATMNTVTNILAKNLHTPELAVSSAIQERMSELLGEIANASDRRAMASESKRRDTFSQWPHMDYKWALPEQMAQAGFYHQPNQPNAPGEDRALCFTCSVCLVCWEKTDEPWSEHERHSQNCAFMMGEYTHNVPISVIYASNPAIDATYRGMDVKVLGTSSVPNLIPASNDEGLVSIFDVSGKITRPHSFYVSQYDSHVLEKITQEFSVLTSEDGSNSYPTEKSVTALSIIDQKTGNNAVSNANTLSTIRPTVVCGLRIKNKDVKSRRNSPFTIDCLDGIDQTDQSSDDMEISYPQKSEKSCLLLVVYDFLFRKNEPKLEEETKSVTVAEKEETTTKQEKEKTIEIMAFNGIGEELSLSNIPPKFLMKHLHSFYKSLIPGETNEICLPPTETEPKKLFEKWPECRLLSSNSSEADSCLPVLHINQDNIFLNGQISNPKEPPQEKSISDHINDLKSKRLSKKLNYSRAVQCFILPSLYKSRNDLIISDILTTLDGVHILVVLKSLTDSGGVLLLYNLDFSGDMVTVNPTPVHLRELTGSENPLQVILLPAIDKFGNSNGSKGIEGNLVMVCSDGAVRIVELASMRTLCYAKLEGEKFTSAAYCNSLERLCVSTEEGSLHFYVLNDTENESLEDHEDEDLFSSSESTVHSSLHADLTEASEMRCFHEPTDLISSSELKKLYSLTQFEPLKVGYCAVVPPCWTEIQQAQRQRRHPQSLSADGEAYTKTWRLQTDLTTWDEHIFEISLPCPMVLGHVDVHFTLQPSTTLPHVEVTLLRQNSNGIGHKRDVNFSVDESITIDMLQWADNPVISQEYLRSHNADILAGPVNIASSLDLTEQSGMVTLTSPKLFKSRNRTLLLHLRVVYSKEEECNRQNKKGKRSDWNGEPGFTPRKSETYMGCDCIHELSITVYASKHTAEIASQMASERQQRNLMLESNGIVLSLIYTLINDRTSSVQNFVLDILNWIASIRLTRNRSNNGEAPFQQIEFISIVENQLHGVLHRSFLSGDRSLAHRCAKLITTCSRGAKNINDNVGESFVVAVMNNLLALLDSIGEVKSAGSLQWYFNILLGVTLKSEKKLVATNCKNLLVRISEELAKKTNPYHLLLRTRYGLYGTPMEPELFDVEPPPYPKGSSVSITYTSVVGGEASIASSDFYNNYSFYKEIINPKEVMSTSDNIMKCKNIASSRLFKGLIETEPLHFACISASEGTRLDKADEANSIMSNIIVNNVPIAYTDSVMSGTSKKEDIQLFWNNVIDMMNDMKNFKGGSQSLSEKFLSHLKDPLNAFIAEDLGAGLQLFSDNYRSNKSETKHATSKNMWQTEDSLSPEFQVNNMWQHLLVGPPQQVIVVERMHSGARRFVILDFGQPVILTDLLIPACNDLVSVSIDVWLKSEDVDPVRIAVSSDIGSRNLVLNDLLPPPICRFMKITVVGRYGMSTTRCRIPIGFFYGHMIIKHDDLSKETASFVKPSAPSDVEKHLANLSKLFEDVSCRYSISCSKLKDTLQGFIVADVKNASHLLSYMNTMKEKNSNVCSLEHNKVFQAYREAITYQRQLNTIRHIMNRLEEKKNNSESQRDLSNICTDKLVAIAEGLLEILLSIDYLNEIDIETCQKLFKGFCVSQSPRLQFLAATYLKNTSAKSDFWGNFLADTLSQMFSSSYSQTFPQDRVFTLICYLSKLSPHRSSVLDAAMRVTYECLSNLKTNRKSLLATSVDLPLMSWLLIYLSLQLDMNKNSNKSVARWDWVFGEMLGKATMENTKTRLHKKALKKQIGTIDSSSNKIPLMHKVSIPISNMPKTKNGQEFFMKMLNYSMPDHDVVSIKKLKETKNPPPHEEKSSPKKNPIYIDEAHIKAVATGLIDLILSMDHSSSADMLLLSFKVVARLSHLSKLSYFSKIRLGHLMNEGQLLNLVNFCLQSKIPWATHALACLLEDFLDLSPLRSTNDLEMETTSVASTSWEPTNETESNTDHIFEEDIISATCIINNKNMQLPSVYESDSSELEELVEEVFGKEQNQSKKRPGKTVISSSTCLNSCAIDSRLDLGVETFSEINLRKLLIQNNEILVQNISSSSSNQEKERKLVPWQNPVQHPSAKTSWSNHKMLKECFHSLFQGLDRQSPECIEQILQLWLTLNCPVKDDKFDRSKIPTILLRPASVQCLISVLAHTPGLSLVTWCIALQTLTLVCNTPAHPETASPQIMGENVSMAVKIAEHPEFVQFLLRLLSEDGVMYSEKGLAGPSLCQAIHDLLVGLRMSFDAMSNKSEICGNFKNLLLNVVYQLIQPSGGPIACRQGPLDAQCKLIQAMLLLNFENADLGIAMSILESTGQLVHNYVTNTDRVRCYYSGDLGSATFRQLYSTVLGTDGVKQERPVSYEFLLITLLRLLEKLVKTRIAQGTDVDVDMENTPPITSQTDESKAEQIQQDWARNVPCLADIALQHHPSIIRLCTTLAACKSSSICMLACISQKNTFVSNFSEPNSLADGVFHVLISLAKSASNKQLIMQPLLMFLSQTSQLSEPLLWFILQILDSEETIRCFYEAGGLSILGSSFVSNISTPNTISKTGTISTVMQYFNKTTTVDCNIPTSSSKKSADEQIENRLSLVNFAPCSSIKCNSTTAQPADILVQGGTTTHRRARTPQWSYHFYPEEVYTELVLTLPSAILLKQVHLQPHSIALSTCPSAIGLEVSATGPSRLVPVGPPMTTSGMPYIQLDLPTPEVVKCVLIRLYKPRMANSISLSQIRLLGFPAFNEKFSSFVSDDEHHCKHSLGWIRLLHHCFSVPTDQRLIKNMVACCAEVPDLLTTSCGLLLVPSHILPDYLPCLEKVVRELSLHNLECSMITLKVLLESKCSSIDLLNSSDNIWQDRLLVNNNGYQSTCELLYQICEFQDANTPYRISTILEWVQIVARNAFATGVINECNPAYLSYVASILWHANANPASLNYDLKSMITMELFDCIVQLLSFFEHNLSLKYSLDSLLCSICYIQPEFYPILLRHFGILVSNLSTDHGASISDDRKDTNSMTDDNKESFVNESGWYDHLVVGNLAQLKISNEQLETVALVSRSPTSVQQLLDSGLPKILISAIHEFCTSDEENEFPMAKLENITAILKFFTEVSEEKIVRDWLGSPEGSSFWIHLLQWLCKKTSFRRHNMESESNVHLEEMCIKFLSKCCLCHPPNQNRLANVLCEVISLQTSVITGFMRRLVLQLLLENEKIPVNITADETLYKSVKTSHIFVPTHPAFKQTYKRALLHLSNITTLSDILEEYIYFNPHKMENSTANKKIQVGSAGKDWKNLFSEESDLSVAAGVLAKDKRAKDNKNALLSSTPVKKKRYAEYPGGDFMGGKVVKCLPYSDQALPLSLTLGQLLKLIEGKKITSDWPCVHLTIFQNKGSNDQQNANNDSASGSSETNLLTKHQSYSSALQVFSAMGGLALLAQHLPTIYPDTIRSPPNQKMSTEQSDSDWIKVEDCEDIYEEETVGSGSLKSPGMISIMPPHSLTAFGLFLRLPGYAEILLKDMKEALCLLRLVLGVTDDGEGGDIFQSAVAPSLPTLPFEVLRKLFDATKLNTDDGQLLRRISISSGVVHLILVCLGIFTHMTPAEDKENGPDSVSKEERSQLYWAKGTGYGTGSTQQSWNVEQALLKQKSEEEHVTILLQVLASYINPSGEAADELAGEVLPATFHDLLINSCLLPVLSSYLRNDSVLDMARHIPLYKAVLLLLRAIAVSSQLLDLLLPQKSMGNQASISSLLKNMKNCVDTYTSKLLNTKSNSKSKLADKLEDVEQGEGLANLMPDIQDSANLVSKITSGLVDSDHECDVSGLNKITYASLDEQYLSIMKKLQFGAYEMITELPEGGIKFVISHHFESNAKATSEQSHPARVKRIAQETVTLSSSLPLSYSSSVFVRYDTSRLDIMKVLITGPADTPYSNGCFELDVFFPHDYPISPMMINLETTGHHSVRFNPNLYNDGKVCLSVLNTWHGRPEEKWNVQTSSFLQVLVSIQSLILVPEPYFNEPGYERSRGTPAGNQSSREYNATICQATVRWAMLEQIINPCPCFGEIILAHFYLKRFEIIDQVDGWVKDFENEAVEKKVSRNNKRTSFYNLDQFKKVVQQLKEQLMKLKPPACLEDEDGDTTPTNSSPTEKPEISNELDNDVEMQKMVNDMCE